MKFIDIIKFKESVLDSFIFKDTMDCTFVTLLENNYVKRPTNGFSAVIRGKLTTETRAQQKLTQHRKGRAEW